MLLNSLLQYILNNNYKVYIMTDDYMVEYAFKHLLTKQNIEIVKKIDTNVITTYFYKSQDNDIDHTHKFIYYMYDINVIDSYFGCIMEEQDLTFIKTNLVQ
jgi:hypothetical protein